jgi:hypothetical protein
MRIAELEIPLVNSRVFSYPSLLVNTTAAHRRVDIRFVLLWAWMTRAVRRSMMRSLYVILFYHNYQLVFDKNLGCRSQDSNKIF